MPAHRPRPALLWAGLLLASVAVSAQTPAVDLDALLARVGGQLERYFQRAQSIVSTETVSVRSFDRGMRPRGRPRRLEYERRVEWDAAGADGVPSVRVMRELRSVNGRPPGPEEENPCLAPETEGDDPLSVLLPARQIEFDFRLRDVEIVDGRPIAKLSFTPIDAQPGEVEWEGDCAHIELEGWYRGDAWVDVGSGDVLRLDEHLTRPFEFREPIDRPRAGRRWSRLERGRHHHPLRAHRVRGSRRDVDAPPVNRAQLGHRGRGVHSQILPHAAVLELPAVRHRRPPRRRARAVGARGESPRCIRPAMHPAWLHCSSVAYAQYAPSSRLATRAPRRSRYNAGFHHELPGLGVTLVRGVRRPPALPAA